MAHQSIRLAHLLAFVALASLASGDLSARGGSRAAAGGGTHARGGAGAHRGAGTQHHASRSGTHRSATASNVNRGNGNRVNNGNINTGNVNVNVNGGYGRGYGYGYHPVARGVVAGATTAAIMGHYYNTLPSGCAVVNQGGLVYHHCGSTWYRTEGTQYVVVQQP
jgi:hypothetical protein